MATAKVGITVSCGSNQEEDNKLRTLTLSPHFVGDEKPTVIQITFGQGGDPDSIAERIEAEFDREADKYNEERADAAAGCCRVPERASSSSRSHTAYHGDKENPAGKKIPRYTTYYVFTFTGLESCDIACDTGKIRSYMFIAIDRKGNPKPEGGATVSSGGGSYQLTEVDCAKYLEELERYKRRRGKDKKLGNSLEASFCDPRNPWKGLVRMDTPWRAATMLLGTSPLSSLGPEDLVSGFSPRKWITVPFTEIPRDRDAQIWEMKLRLANAGIAVNRTPEGAVVPMEIIAGELLGEELKVFGIMTPYDPLGYGPFAWSIIMGEPDSVVGHATAAESGNHAGVAVAPQEWQVGILPPVRADNRIPLADALLPPVVRDRIQEVTRRSSVAVRETRKRPDVGEVRDRMD